MPYIMLQNRNMGITERDIKRVEQIFFKGEGSFEDEKRERYSFISCIDRSIDVEACPGSGKTTSLLAKLYLLSEKMPFENGKGFCVLTHTNVAINEIKSRLGNKADRLFRYPNFFGTIQSFVDKYLAIPYYTSKYKKRPNGIDSQLVAKRLQNTYLEYNLKDKVGQVKFFLVANELFDKITFKRTANEEYTLIKGINGEQIELKKPRSKFDWSPKEKEELYNLLFRLRWRVFLESALLSYDDAYFLAQEYLIEFPKVRPTISSRFSHVFIDEMQDTYSHQNAIIKSIFDHTVVIQRIGDSNQAILNDNQSESAWENSERLKITGSRRFSQSIAHILKTVAVKGDPNLTGTNNVVILPHIISYQTGNESIALEKFVSLIHLFGLDDDNKFKYPIKAVGWVGKQKEGLTLCTYYKPFSKNLKTIKSFNNLRSAVSLSDISDPKKLQSVIIDCCLEILQLSGIKNLGPKGLRSYTKTSFYNLLKQNYPETLLSLNTNIAIWAKGFAKSKTDEIIPYIRSYFKNSFYPTLNFTINKKGIEFIDSNLITGANEDNLKSKNIFYSEQVELKHIPVEIATIHSVKGETHRATLYLETFFHKTCGEYLMDQLTGITYNGQGGKRKEMCLRIAHVGMSRPTHLLCVALNEKIVSQNKNALEDNNWIII